MYLGYLKLSERHKTDRSKAVPGFTRCGICIVFVSCKTSKKLLPRSLLDIFITNPYCRDTGLRVIEHSSVYWTLSH